MTTHTGLTHEQEPFTMTLTLPAFLDALTDVLAGHAATTAPFRPEDLSGMIRAARARLDEHPTPDHWSDWLDWAGGPCPLPPTTKVECETGDGAKTPPGDGVSAQCWAWCHLPKPGLSITRFRYATHDPAGWLPRGDFIPPDALWDEACPVRCEWTRGLPTSHPGHWLIDSWDAPGQPVTHIRLRPRERAGEACDVCEMPEGFRISAEGSLYARRGIIFTKGELEKHGPDTIRRAVDAWLASMKERGNG